MRSVVVVLPLDVISIAARNEPPITTYRINVGNDANIPRP